MRQTVEFKIKELEDAFKKRFGVESIGPITMSFILWASKWGARQTKKGKLNARPEQN